MFNRFLLIALFSLAGTLCRAQEADSLWEASNAAYMEGRYAESARGYESIRSQGLESAKLYLNLGNAYYKQGMIGKAILNYNRSLVLSPGEEDATYNLSIANAYVQDKIDAVPVFFIKRWVGELRDSLSGNTWAVLSLVLFALALAGAVLYLLTAGLTWRKVGFYGSLGCLVLFLYSLGNAARAKHQARHPHTAIVMSSAAPVKSSPDAGSKDIFVLHEGTRVSVRDSLGDFREIVIASGDKGWISAQAIETVD